MKRFSPRKVVEFVLRDFVDFVLHQKKWWVTVLAIVVGAFLMLVFFTEPHGVRPIIYSND